MSNGKINVTLAGDGIMWTGTVDRATAAMIAQMMEGADGAESRTLEALMSEAAPRNNFQRFAVLAAHREATSGRPLSWGNIRDLMERAGCNRPANLHRDVRRAIEEGWLEPDGPHPDEVNDKERVQETRYWASGKAWDVLMAGILERPEHKREAA